MDGRVAPALVEEASRAVEVVKVLLVLFRPEEAEAAYLKVGPEVAGGVAASVVVVVGPRGLDEPLAGVVWVDVLRELLEKVDGCWPQRLDGVRRVVEVQDKSVVLVVVLHVRKDVVVDGAVVIDVGLDTPVVVVILERVIHEKGTRVPATHFVVGSQVGVLDIVLFGHLATQAVCLLLVDPFGLVPLAGREMDVCAR